MHAELKTTIAIVFRVFMVGFPHLGNDSPLAGLPWSRHKASGLGNRGAPQDCYIARTARLCFAAEGAERLRFHRFGKKVEPHWVVTGLFAVALEVPSVVGDNPGETLGN